MTDKVLEETMASVLEDAWNRLTLTGDEEEAAIFEERNAGREAGRD